MTDKQRVKLLKVLTNELDKMNTLTAQEQREKHEAFDDGYQSRLDEEEVNLKKL